jgi:hypothetical protein
MSRDSGRLGRNRANLSGIAENGRSQKRERAWMVEDEWVAVAIYGGLALVALAFMMRRYRGGWRLF